MDEEISGKLFVGQVSGPVLGGQIVVDSPEGELALDSFLRPFLGKYVSITVEVREPTDAELERSSSNRPVKYTPGR